LPQYTFWTDRPTDGIGDSVYEERLCTVILVVTDALKNEEVNAANLHKKTDFLLNGVLQEVV